MEKIIKKVLSMIEKNGFEAYVIGGYVRDFLLGKHSYDIDICTNALPKDLKKIFPYASTGIYGSASFKLKKYNFEVTTYREEIDYKDRHPKSVKYVSNLIEDLKRRDFTMNTICINQKGQIIDIFKGSNDINLKRIEMVGNVSKKMNEDPLRIFRAIRFATILNFELSNEIFSFIYNHAELVKSLSYSRIKNELDKILLSDNCLKGIDLLNELRIFEVINIKCENIKKVEDLCGMYAQMNINCDLPFTKEENNHIIKIKSIIKYGITNRSLYENGLYLCTVAAQILNNDLKLINKMYKSLAIKSPQDLAITPNKLLMMTKAPGKEFGNIINILVEKILEGTMKNDRKSITNYLKEEGFYCEN